MRFNAEFDQPATEDISAMDWIPSPAAGVERKMLDRVGEEVARATSIVRYAAGSAFPDHTHGGGEEFFVLEGTFSDQYGDFPTGTYVRNPIGTSHAPRSDGGCVIWVKLQQFEPEDQEQKAIDTSSLPGPGEGESFVAHDLHRFGSEHVTFERWSGNGLPVTRDFAGGFEMLVLEGVVEVDGRRFAAGNWLRLPNAATIEMRGIADSALLLKRGHLG